MNKFDSILHLIKTAKRTNSTIICINKNEIDRINAIAKSININIKTPKNIKDLNE